MKLIMAFGVGAALLASAASAAPANSPYGGYRAPQPTYGRMAPIAKTAPIYSPKAPDPNRFKPYQGTSTYSNRGGVNAYPAPAKPKGYLSPYGK
ncbi:hypothetical protein [Phenylobacterium sp.]|uniref:hypothetical protein n=1 Tax=Phenylobacterium sp. TaxID=1871053 RepID=UPI00286AF9E6|nr:hypothetical protein [Phenylobacterium sp.]